MDPSPAVLDLPHRLGLVVLGLAQLVANQFSKDPSNEPFIFRIYTSLRRRLRRFERVFAQAQAELLAGARDGAAPPAGTEAQPFAANPAEVVAAMAAAEPPPTEPTPAKAGAGVDRKPVRKPYHRLPRKRAWMLIMMPHQAALYWYRLDDLLRDPEMVAFLATSAKARRLLRPLWYGLCGDKLPACLREPPKPAHSREATVPAGGVAPAATKQGAVARRSPEPTGAPSPAGGVRAPGPRRWRNPPAAAPSRRRIAT